MVKIYAFIQMFNESITGNLERCLNNCKQWADDIIIYDDKSTDDSVQLAKKYTNNIILGNTNEWTKETFHKQTLLNYIHKMDVKPDWLLWVDCDEIIDKSFITNAKIFCKDNLISNVDAYSFQQINLWRGETHYRTDGMLYGENFLDAGWFVRLWKYNTELQMNTIVGPDQRLYPSNIKNIQPAPFKIIHYGFSNYKKTMKHIGVNNSTKQQLIDTASGNIYVKLLKEGNKWADAYVLNGKGIPNMFLNEENLSVCKCPVNWFPTENIPQDNIYVEPKRLLNEHLITYDNILTNVVFLGNCQMKIIAKYCEYYLKEKCTYFNIVIDLSKQSNKVDYNLQNADIIITQPFYPGNYYSMEQINKLKNSKCKLIKTHCIYYDGYFPQNNIKEYEKCEQNNQLTEQISNLSKQSLLNLFDRENGNKNYINVDIPLYDYFKKNYKNKRLMLRHNHPTNSVMNQCAYLIYNKICKNEYYQNKQLIEYNIKFDNSREELNAPDTYEIIDEFTKKTLGLKF